MVLHRYAVISAISLLSFWGPAAWAAGPNCDFRYFLNLQGTYVDFHDRVSEEQTGSGGRIGIGRRNCLASGYSHWEFNLGWNGVDGPLNNDNTQFGLILSRLRLYGNDSWHPFWQAGFGLVKEEVVAYNSFYPALEGGVGLLWQPNPNGWGIRADAVVQGLFNDDAQVARRFHHDGRLALGVIIPLGRAAAAAVPPPPPPRIAPPPPAPAPAPIPPPPPPDSDQDGVIDARDQCPNTPIGTTVDSVGCPVPLDSDGDGVLDASDACPGTLPGLRVDERGCVVKERQAVVLQGVVFAAYSYELDEAARARLDEAYAALSGDPSLRVEIEGHTDTSGLENNNRVLSQQRADTVLRYLVGRGISARRLQSVGHGSNRPIAANASADGRALNRRVELRILE